MPGCVFCAIVAGDAEAFVVGQDEDAVAFLDVAPVGRGHTLVVPRHHVPDLLDGGAQVLAEVAPLVAEVARRLVSRLGADGVNLFQSSGAAAGQEVFHFHVHLLPRWEGDGVLGGLVRAGADATGLDDVHQVLTG